MNIKIDDKAALEIAKRSRGTPRISNRILKRARDFAQIQSNGQISLEIANTLIESGYSISDTNKYADIFVLNTCTVTHIADRKARNRIRNFKRSNPESTIVATGCYAERSPEFIKSMEEVDLVISNKAKEKINWKPKTSFDKGLKSTIRFYNEQSA